MISEPVAAVSQWITLIGSLGSATAAVAVVYLFMGFLRESVKRQEDMYERLTMEFGSLSKEKGEVIHQVSISLENNTRAIQQLESTVQGIGEQLRG